MKAPRIPTGEELDAIADAAIDGDRHDFEWQETRDQLNGARVAIFDSYISDGPGYRGRVAVVVWSGGPELFDVFTLDSKPPGPMIHGERRSATDYRDSLQRVLGWARSRDGTPDADGRALRAIESDAQRTLEG